jgi:acyl carrier protein
MTDSVESRIQSGVLEFITSAKITRDTKIDALGIDSLEFLSMVQDLEKEFGVPFTADEVVTCETIGDLVKLVESKCP